MKNEKNKLDDLKHFNINDTLIIKTSPLTIIFSLNNKLLIYEIDIEKNTSKIIKEISFVDEIIYFNKLNIKKENSDYILACKNNKNIYIISEINYEIKFTFTHSKKLTSIFIFNEEENDFIFFSDKCGEIWIKKFNKNTNEEQFLKESKLICGHCDPIIYMQISNNNKLMLSSDTFGKIKIYEFPNLFNILSVCIYLEDDIKYINFFGELDSGFFVLNKNNNIDIWSSYDFILQSKENINLEKDDNIKYIKLLDNNKLILLSNKKIFYYQINSIKYCLENKKEINIDFDIENTKIRLFYFNDKIYLILLNINNNEIKLIKNILIE